MSNTQNTTVAFFGINAQVQPIENGISVHYSGKITPERTNQLNNMIFKTIEITCLNSGITGHRLTQLDDAATFTSGSDPMEETYSKAIFNNVVKLLNGIAQGEVDGLSYEKAIEKKEKFILEQTKKHAEKLRRQNPGEIPIIRR